MSPRSTTDETASGKGNHQASVNAVRGQAARVLRIVFGVLATILALGALLVVLRSNINPDNSIVKLVLDVADKISGPFSRDHGIFHFTGKHAIEKNALLNWGIAAIVYLVIGRFLANAVGPKGTR